MSTPKSCKQATSCPRLESGDQEDLQVRVGEYHGAHVSAVRHEISVHAQYTLGTEQPLTDSGQACNDRNVLGHFSRAQLGRKRLAVTVDVHSSLTGPRLNAKVIEIRGGERRPLLRGDPFLQQRESQRPIEPTGVEMAKSQAPGQLPGSGGLSRARRAVDGDDQSASGRVWRPTHGRSPAPASPPGLEESRSSIFQNPGKLTSTTDVFSTSMRLPGRAPKTPNAMAMR